MIRNLWAQSNAIRTYGGVSRGSFLRSHLYELLYLPTGEYAQWKAWWLATILQNGFRPETVSSADQCLLVTAVPVHQASIFKILVNWHLFQQGVFFVIQTLGPALLKIRTYVTNEFYPGYRLVCGDADSRSKAQFETSCWGTRIFNMEILMTNKIPKAFLWCCRSTHAMNFYLIWISSSLWEILHLS